MTKPADKAAVVTLSTGHYQSMIMEHLWDENTYNKLYTCFGNKIESKLLRFLGQHKVCFTEAEEKFLNDKHYEVSNLCGLPKIHKNMIIESVINTQKSEINEIFKSNDLKLRPIIPVNNSKCPTRKINQLMDIH